MEPLDASVAEAIVAILAAAQTLTEDCLTAFNCLWNDSPFDGKHVVLRRTSGGEDEAQPPKKRQRNIVWQWPSVVHATGVLPQNSPRWWVMRRSGDVWKDLEIVDDAENDHYVSQIRMRRSNFNRLRHVLAPHLAKKVTKWRAPLPPAQVLAYALHRWAHGDSHLHSTSAYGMGKTSGLRALREVGDASIEHFPAAVGFGSYAVRHKRMQKFAAAGFPNCWGCIDDTHVFVDKPKKKDGDEFMAGHKKRFSIVAQLVFDLDLRILDMCYRFPGTVADGRVLRNSSLFRKAVRGGLFQAKSSDPTRHLRPTVPGVPNGYLLADAGYPTLSWIVVPYGIHNPPVEIKVFDDTHKLVCSCAEHGNGVLMMRFQYFYRPHVCDIRIEGKEFQAACILHNLLLSWGDLPEGANIEGVGGGYGDQPANGAPRSSAPLRHLRCRGAGLAVRDALCDYLNRPQDPIVDV
ncbi:hypothetical protein CBR_g49504 [Chara braunii]|uniref:DDE Tnp4 domain-containing protein n=1 Tax=Chara braunii TaxID=69332 RepID=A0A388K505_CHABU|nr:hypothetical protein CBR_g49504 [Chara braunii]|eukprot:GBG65142.1 hypothetical protein CBR_g49504 [Chara braunii]